MVLGLQTLGPPAPTPARLAFSLADQTHALVLSQQALYELSHLPSPETFPRKVTSMRNQSVSQGLLGAN